MSRRSSSDDGGVLGNVVEHTSPMLQILDPGQIQTRCVQGKMQVVTEDPSLASILSDNPRKRVTERKRKARVSL